MIEMSRRASILRVATTAMVIGAVALLWRLSQDPSKSPVRDLRASPRAGVSSRPPSTASPDAGAESTGHEMVWQDIRYDQRTGWTARVRVRFKNGVSLKWDSHRECVAVAYYVHQDGREQRIPATATSLQNDPGTEYVCSIRSRDAMPADVRALRIRASASSGLYDMATIVRERAFVRPEAGYSFLMAGRRFVVERAYEDVDGNAFVDSVATDGNVDGLASAFVLDRNGVEIDDFWDAVVVYNYPNRSVVSMPVVMNDDGYVVLRYERMDFVETVEVESERMIELRF